MRRVRWVALAITVVAAAPDALAARAPASLAGRAELEVAAGPPVRAAVQLQFDRVPAGAARAWAGLVAETGPSWRASWDADTGVPSRLWGAGIRVPGAMAVPAIAEEFARDFLTRHVALLAPGSAPADFVLVANHLGGGIRSVGFAQRHQGMPVVGGQVSFRFKNDRLFMIGSEALPHVRTAAPRTLAAIDARARARGWIGGAGTVAGSVSGPVVLPLIGEGRVLGYHTAMVVDVSSRRPIGRWDVYLDAATGAPVARRQTLRFAQATLRFNAPERHALGTRSNYPARRASVIANNVAVDTDDAGLFAWDGTGSATVTTRATGPLVSVVNDAGTPATGSFNVASGGSLVWNAGAEQMVDAQLSAFIHGRIVKEYCRTFAPDLAFLDQTLIATVNIDDECNAYSDGTTINFFKSSINCQNTALVIDVVYHEFGHALHYQSIIEGVGARDGAFSEGLSDYLAATIQNDSGMGRGFFYAESPLRDIDPADGEWRWPEHISEIHQTGLIFAGAMWDLRKLMIATYGQAEGVRRADLLFYAAVQRASNTPTTYLEILAADDDDGDLTNGTPHGCMVNQAFGPHGLRGLSIDMSPLSAEPPSPSGHALSLAIGSAIPACPGEELSAAVIDWRLRSDPTTGGSVPMTLVDGRYTAAIPTQEDGTVVSYQVRLDFADDNTIRFPANPADPWYEFYIGDVESIYCTDFETDPFAESWTHALDSGSAQEGADDWSWGPMGPANSSGDPVSAYSGLNVIGNDLGGSDYNGMYQANKINSATSPLIQVGAYSDVRLQYRRWLNVEDAYYDKASIVINGALGWRNLDSDMGDASSTHHQDGEWRFHDVPLSPYIRDGVVQVKFELETDGGLEFGGWTIDDFCVVALRRSVCGDGETTGYEQCDEGAANDDLEADACRSDCRAAFCGDGVVDSGERCDDGDRLDTGPCTANCQGGPDANDGGCCSTGSGGGGRLAGFGLLALLVAWSLRRRRG